MVWEGSQDVTPTFHRWKEARGQDRFEERGKRRHPLLGGCMQGEGSCWCSSLGIAREEIWYQTFHLKHRLCALLKMFKGYKWTDGCLSYKSNLCSLDHRVWLVRHLVSKGTEVLIWCGDHPEFNSQLSWVSLLTAAYQLGTWANTGSLWT